jgi:hypothetical protein
VEFNIRGHVGRADLWGIESHAVTFSHRK